MISPSVGMLAEEGYGLDVYDSISHLKTSNCSNALNFSYKYFPRKYVRNLTIVPNIEKVKIKLINIGLGTTGTRDLARMLCEEFRVVSLHYTASCNTYHHGIAEQFAPLRWYFDVKASDFLLFCSRVVAELVEEYEYLTDDPFAELFLEIFPIAPHISVLATLRDPTKWAKRRKEMHSLSVICHYSLWTNTDVFHPFDIFGCLHAVGPERRVGEALITLQNISEDLLAQAFIQYYTISFHHVLASGCPLRVFCLWDLPAKKHSISRLAITLNQFWKENRVTQPFPSRSGDGGLVAKQICKLRTNRILQKYDFGSLIQSNSSHSNINASWTVAQSCNQSDIRDKYYELNNHFIYSVLPVGILLYLLCGLSLLYLQKKKRQAKI